MKLGNKALTTKDIIVFSILVILLVISQPILDSLSMRSYWWLFELIVILIAIFYQKSRLKK